MAELTAWSSLHLARSRINLDGRCQLRYLEPISKKLGGTELPRGVGAPPIRQLSTPLVEGGEHPPGLVP